MRFPLSYANGSKMLTAYFDDSGTHDDSAFVLYGGLYGTDEQWKEFDIAWKTKLANPVPNRPPIQRFHMVDCHHRHGQFLGYSKGEQDVLIHDLRNTIISHNLHGYCCGGSRADWDDLVLGDMRSFLGDVERFCVTQCFVWVDGWAERNGYEALAYVLDNRPHRTEANRQVFEFFQRYHEVTKEGPINKDISFESSLETTPLQAADLVAWEYYQLGKEWLLTRDESKKRAHLQRLSEARIMDVHFFGREHIEEMVA